MFVILLTLLKTFYDIVFLLYKKKKRILLLAKKLKNNELEQFLCSPFKLEKNIPKASLTIAKIVDNNNEKTEKLLAKISELENKLSIVYQVLSEETTAKLELQHEVKTLYKNYKVVSGQFERKVTIVYDSAPKNPWL